MGQGITGEPNTYRAGLDFDYSVWTAGTRVDLVNVNWNNDYRDVVRFADRATLNKFIDGKASQGITISKMVYAKPGQDILLGIPYNKVNRYNYLRASNPLMPIDGDIQKDFYYFILEAEYVNPQTTRLKLQLDVWQTYVYDITLGNCYVERGHIGIANSKSFTNFGRDYLTVPEGMDVGGEYIAGKGKSAIFGTGVIVAISTVDLDADPGDATNPLLKTSPGASFVSNASNTLNPTVSFGASVYYWASATKFKQFLSEYADKPWITQNIIGVYSLPPLSVFGQMPDGLTESSRYHGYSLNNFQFKPQQWFTWSNWRNDSSVIGRIPDRYKILKKLWTYPYMALELTTWLGKPIALKPESWQSDNGDIIVRGVFGTTQQRLEIAPLNYNSNGEAGNNPSALLPYYNGGDYFDVATYISDFPSLPVVSNGGIAYLAANKNQIAFQYQSAGWEQQRALAGAQAGYDIASGAMRTNSEAGNISRYADIAQTANVNRTLAAQGAVNAATGLVGAGGSGAAMGMAMGPAGAVAGAAGGAIGALGGAINTGIQEGANSEALAIRQSTTAQNVANENTQTGLVRDTNVGLARFSARGDYANEIAGINAKVRDAALIQPTVSGQIGGDFTTVLNGTGYMATLIVKTMQPSSMAAIGEFWLRYGYAIQRFLKPPQSLMVMTKFTYWKMRETYMVAANVPEGHKQVIRGILEKGVTCWASPDDIGNIDMAANQPLAGVSY